MLDTDRFQAVAHPSGITVIRDEETTSIIWPGRAATALELPDVVFGRGGSVDGADHGARDFLGRIGREAEPYRIYDPYGWYQISHAAELEERDR